MSRTAPSKIANLDAQTLAQWTDEDPRNRRTDHEILEELAACADRLGVTPTIREFADDKLTTIHPQTVIARLGSWNAACRILGLRPRRSASDAELLQALRDLGNKLGRTPRPADLVEHKKEVPSQSLYYARMGGLNKALRAAGFDVASNADEKLDHAIECAISLVADRGELPSFVEWGQMRREGADLPSEWQIYRLCTTEHGKAWRIFSKLVEQASDQHSHAA